MRFQLQMYVVGLKFLGRENDRGARWLNGRPCGAFSALNCAIQFAIVPAVNGSMSLDPDCTHVSNLRVSCYLEPSAIRRSSDCLPSGN